MKFVKVIINGKEYYERVDDKEAKREKRNEEPEIIDAEVTDSDEPSRAEKWGREASAFFDKLNTSSRDLSNKIVTGAKDLGEKIKSGTERLFNRDKSNNSDSTEAKLLRLLPYMSKKEAHEVAEKFLENDELLSKLDITTVMPFLSKDDCNSIFKKCIALGNVDFDLAKATQYVSDSCLSSVVDDYIAGRLPNLDIDEFYPFLKDSDIKRLFYHILANDKKD
jgi:hypothetical protein